MRAPRIFTEQILGPNVSIELERGPSQHIARALRMRVGGSLLLFNGDGGEYAATITAVDKNAVRISTQDHYQTERESPLSLELGIAISRGDRMDWVIQKATELGVASITPLTSERTEVKLKADRASKKHKHWRQIIISACEQCGRNRLPELQALKSVNQWLPHVVADRKFVLHHRHGSAQNTGQKPTSVAVLVGPEGGLSPQEIDIAKGFDFEPLSLGPRILRTETAPIATLAILQAQWGDMPPEI